MKGIFGPYVLWLFDKKSIFWIVTRVSACDYTVGVVPFTLLNTRCVGTHAKIWISTTNPTGVLNRDGKEEETSDIDEHGHECVKHLDSKGLKNKLFQITKYKFLYINITIFDHILLYFLNAIGKTVQDGKTTKRRYIERKDTGACLIPSPRKERGVSNDIDLLEDGFLHLVSTKLLSFTSYTQIIYEHAWYEMIEMAAFITVQE